MRIEVVSIGNELLSGRVVNTNAAFICRQLAQQGYETAAQTTLPDEKRALGEGLARALDRSDLVITTGGLGPTQDDTTRTAVATLFDSGFSFHAQWAQRLKARYGDERFAIEDQATLPSKAHLLPNEIGSAPGLVFSEKGKTLIALPGVPQEMELMFLQEVLPLLQRLLPKKPQERLCLHFCLLYESLLDPQLRDLSRLYPSVEIGVYPSYGSVTLTLASSRAQDLQFFHQALHKRFSSYIYEAPSGRIEEALYLSCMAKEKKVACAESCTGGRLAATITTVPGASNYFWGSIVAYSNEMKKQLLGVKETTLSQYGAVSEQTVQEMLKGIFAQTHADYAIAVSGVAGPTGGSADKPVGTVYAAIGERGKACDVGRFHVAGDRNKITSVATQSLLGALWRKIEKQRPAFPFIEEA